MNKVLLKCLEKMLYPELYGEIILRAGGIPLLMQISKHLCHLYSGLIGEYDIVTSPISWKEIEQYLSKRPEHIRVIVFNNNIYSRNYSYWSKGVDCYCSDEVISYDNDDGFIKRQNFMLNENMTLIEAITGYQIKNYDLSTALHILQQRTNNLSLVKTICLDTLIYHSKTLTDKALWVYCYVNIQAFNILCKYDRGEDRYEDIMRNISAVNVAIVNNLIGNEIQYFISLLKDYLQNDCSRYGNYIIPAA